LILNKKRPHVIIVGANFSGLTAASKLSTYYAVTVIAPTRNFQWTPNIHEILSDVKKQTSVSLNLEIMITRLGHHFINQAVTAIDGQLQTVTLDDQQTLSYDVLLIASGHARSNYGIKGASEYACGFRTADNVMQVHRDITAAIDGGKQAININIIGGGFTGVEVLGELLRKYSDDKRLHINVIDRASRLVQALPEKLSTDILERCKNHQIKFHFNKKIIEVKKDSILLSDQESINSDVTIWSAGTKLPDYLNNIDTEKSTNGLAVNTYLQTKSFSNIFIAGDSAMYPTPLPKQASIAMDMGGHAASNIERFCAKKPLKPFKVSATPVLLSLGDINTYFIQDKLVLASPMLAAAKEAVYQLYMARLSTLLPLEQRASSLASRVTLSADKLLLTEVFKLRPKVLLQRSKIL
jgi:NADH:ubiquinone reductase (non-electrogenic)